MTLKTLPIPLLLALAAAAAPAPEIPKLSPPQPPAHQKRSLGTAAELSRDLAETVAFIEDGQAFFRAYSKGTHSAQENKEFVRFLEDFEREQDLVKKEVEALGVWAQKKSGLKD